MKKTMLIFIIFVSLAPGFLAIIQYLESAKKEKENLINEKDLNQKIKTLLDDNVKLSRQLTETALELHDNVIGASDLDIQIIKHNISSDFIFRFINDSALPVVNANITIHDYSEIKKCEVIKENDKQVVIKLDCYKNNFIKETGINLNPFGAIVFSTKSFNLLKDYMNFAIQLETRSKIIIYHLVYKFIDGEMVRSHRVYNLVNGEKLFKSEKNTLNLDNDYWNNNFYEKVLFTN
jgi:hypothetical protein